MDRGEIAEARIELECARGLKATVEVSWVADEAVRRTVIDGTDGRLCRDDRTVTLSLDALRSLDVPGGDQEPLRRIVGHFVDCITTGARPRTDGHTASRHLVWLEAARHSIAAGGRAVDLSTGAFL